MGYGTEEVPDLIINGELVRLYLTPRGTGILNAIDFDSTREMVRWIGFFPMWVSGIAEVERRFYFHSQSEVRGPAMAFEGVRDNPEQMVLAALDQAREASMEERDREGIRMAAELGWLAASSMADVVAHQLGMGKTRGFIARRKSLEELETKAKIHRDSLTSGFDRAKRTLHGECFHANEIATKSVIIAGLEDVKGLIDLATEALKKVRRKHR